MFMPMGSDQTEFKSTVKQWLRSRGLDYGWMAERCGVSEITMRNWMSRKFIPPLKVQLMERAMEQQPQFVSGENASAVVAGVEVNAKLSLTVQLVPELYWRLTERALAAGATPETLVAQVIADLLQEPSDALKDMKQRAVTLPTNSQS